MVVCFSLSFSVAARSVEAMMYGYRGTLFFPIVFCCSSVEAAMYGLVIVVICFSILFSVAAL